MIFVHVKAKSLLCYWAVSDLGIGMAQIVRRLNLSGRGESVGKAGRNNSTTKGLTMVTLIFLLTA